MKRSKFLVFTIFSRRITYLLLVLVVLLATCTSVEKEWDEAKQKHSIEGYESFLTKYPDSEFSKEALRLKIKLEEENDWSDIKQKHSIEAYESFLSKYPDSEFSKEALRLKAKLEEENAWADAIQQNTIEGYEAFLSNYPESKHLKDALIKKSSLLPNIEFKKIKKGMLLTLNDVYGIPKTVWTSSGLLIAEYVIKSSWITGLNAYFYLFNKGAKGSASLKITYSDDLGTKTTKVKKLKFSASQEYKVRANIKFDANVSVIGAPYGTSRLNTITMILPDGKGDTFSARIPSWKGSISDIEIVQDK